MSSPSLIPQPPPISDDSSHRMIEGRHDKSLDGGRRTEHMISFSNFELSSSSTIQYTEHLPHGAESLGRFEGASRLHLSLGHQAANPPRSDEYISDTGHVAPKPDGTRICLTSHTAPNSGIPGQPSLEAGGAKEAKCFCENLELGIMPPARLIHNGNLYRVKQDPVEYLSTLEKPFAVPFGYVILHGAKDWVTEGTLVVGCYRSALACFQCKKTVKCDKELRPDQINGLLSTIE
ncbi:hypothetical protein BDP55DRAFT_683701 [Colletotrichum godetiae]|uniref:Uncharacterized protein n=1 Tax=Colletotrichum godetiae TaxID=1209918 RepID=A0AAJ0ER18_9PEZI|nr:uncharacterized protein BDP55DRAFT_683701 [Colletotrichum godetiae]KAK1658053.1 hypothetical protein BDP55DRAFT_683701 [Colletotrichum godetiae]